MHFYHGGENKFSSILDEKTRTTIFSFSVRLKKI